jgi:hypothetical protein
MHDEIGQTQFMPKNILAYGTGNLDVTARRAQLDREFPHGPWMECRRGIPARRSQFRGHLGHGMPFRSTSTPSR